MRYDSPAEDYEAHSEFRRTCRKCYEPSRNLEDGWCPRCNGQVDESEDRDRARRAWAKFFKQHPELAR